MQMRVVIESDEIEFVLVKFVVSKLGSWSLFLAKNSCSVVKMSAYYALKFQNIVHDLYVWAEENLKCWKQDRQWKLNVILGVLFQLFSLQISLNYFWF